MPKKSEQTLAKEAAFKEQAQKEWEALPVLISGTAINPVIQGKVAKPVKGYDKLYVRPVEYAPLSTLILTKVQMSIPKYWGPLGLLMDPFQRLVVLNQSHNITNYSMWLSGKLVRINLAASAHNNIQGYITHAPLTDFAAVCTWPNEFGKAKLYVHEHSGYMPKATVNQLKTKIDGVNREHLVPSSVQWEDVAKYIVGRTALSWGVNQRAVCDLVKAVSKNISDAEIKLLSGE